VNEREADLQAIASLSEPSRRALYEFVSSSPGDVSRDTAAKATGLSRMLAAFHLDRLVRAGLLEATFARVSGRSGPGAGRPSKLYHRARRPVTVSFPQRQYQLVAELFAQAAERAGQGPMRDALAEAAHEVGRKLSQESGTASRAGASTRKVMAALERLGFEPYRDGRVLRLRNCPFDALAKEHRELTCSTNLCLMEGLLEGLGVPANHAKLEPLTDGCCVAFQDLSA
jgi:predicted ArsR family transcriptional regulator